MILIHYGILKSNKNYMNEEVQFYLDEAKERMEAALNHLETELS